MNRFILGILILFSVTSCNPDKFTLYFKVQDACGLAEDNEIQLNGVKIGQVINIGLGIDYNILVKTEFDESVKFPTDSDFLLASSDILGKKCISVQLGSNSNLIKNGDTLSLIPEAPFNIEVFEEMTNDLMNNNPLINYLDSLSTQLEEINEKLDKQN